MKHTIAVLVVVFSVGLHAQTQDVVSEAKAKIAQEKHDSLVSKAKSLLQDKADLEAKLAAVNAKLDKLAKGEDVATGSDIAYYGGSSTISSGNLITSTTPFNCCAYVPFIH